MTRRRVLRSVLHSFLGTFTSRYSDLDGYWLFGLLLADSPGAGWPVDIDLLGESPRGDSACPWQFARHLAAQRFTEQVARARLPRDRVQSATLSISHGAERTSGFVNGRMSSGHILTFEASAITDLGRHYASTVSVFVAPHDPAVESRSLRAR